MTLPRLCILVVLLVGATIVHRTACATDPASGRTPPAGLRDLVRTDNGTVWGIVPSPSPDSGLYCLQGGRWQIAPVVGLPAKCRPLCQTQRADGAAVCLWTDDSSLRMFSVQRSGEARATAGVATARASTIYYQPERLLADSKNNVWFTSANAEIYRLLPDGRADCPHLIQPGECTGQNFVEPGGHMHCAPVMAFEAGEGQICFCSGVNMGGGSLRGLLVFDGKAFTSHDLIVRGEPNPFIEVPPVPRDAGHTWVAELYRGLCILDTAAFTLERVPDQPREMDTVRSIFRHGGDLLLVCWPNIVGRPVTLWRLRAGRWELLIDRVDVNPSANPGPRNRLWVPMLGGCLLGSIGSGGWFVPDEGMPVHLNWRQGFPLATPRDLVPLPDGQNWLGTDVDGRSWVGEPKALLAAAVRNDHVWSENPVGSLVSDRRHHLWEGLADSSPNLREWDGGRWTAHPLPSDPELTKGYRSVLGADKRQRFWGRLDGVGKRRFYLFDPADDRWQWYEKFEQMLEAQAPLGREAEPPWHPSNGFNELARFGPYGQICYLDDQSRIAWFDGGQWHRWSRYEVCGREAGRSFGDLPFFSAGDRPRVNIDEQPFEYDTQEGRWRPAAVYEAGYTDAEERMASNPPPVPPPAAQAKGVVTSFAFDPEGVCWFTSKGELYRCRGQQCAPVFRPGEAHPFQDDRRLDSVLIDARSNAFLHTPDRGEYVVVAPLSPPRTTLAFAPAGSGTAADHAKIQLASDAGPLEGKVRFEWRLDGGAWQSVAADTPSATVVLDGLPAGAHRFEARSFDAALQTDATRAALDWQVDLDAQAQIAGYIAQLADPDEARRKAAVLALARQPELALPALRAARAKTEDESQRWWIDATLQQIVTNHMSVTH